MRALVSVAVALALVLTLMMGAVAEDKKAVKLTGEIKCGKCHLKKDKDCATVIVVKKGDKETVYYFDAASHKKYHKQICTEEKEGTVTGTISKKGDKNIITVSKLTFKE
jgi:hypothetical protein